MRSPPSLLSARRSGSVLEYVVCDADGALYVCSLSRREKGGPRDDDSPARGALSVDHRHLELFGLAGHLDEYGFAIGNHRAVIQLGA